MAEWNFALPGWFDRLQEGRSLLPDLPLDHKEAARAVGIYNKIRLPDVPGQPPLSEAAGEWQRDIVRALFGSLDETGKRRVREIFCQVPKKNSKTTTGAAVMITAMLMNKRPRAEFLLIGPTQHIADTAFQQAAGMIAADPYLEKRFHPVEHEKKIIDRLNKARLRVKTLDMKVMTGVKPVGALIDELHVMGDIHYATRVIGQIRGGLLPNPEGFLVFITTQSDEEPAGVFKAELDYARGVRDGKITDSRMLPMLYEFPEVWQIDPQKPWANPANWPMVHPNLGRPFTVEDLVKEYTDAKAKGEEEERRWASQHLNIQVGLGTHAGTWIGSNYWAGAADRRLTLDAILARSEVVIVGVDGGGLDDLLGVAVLGRDKETKDWLLWSKAWAQNDVLERRKNIAERLLDFQRDGDLVISDDPMEVIHSVADLIEKVYMTGLLPEKYGVGFDPYGVSAMVDELAARGIDNDLNGGPVCSVAQGTRLSQAVWGAEVRLKNGALKHAGQPMMSWVVGNAKVEQRGNAVMITKEVSGKAKIDPLIAAFNAVMLMSRNPEATGAGMSDYFKALASAA